MPKIDKKGESPNYFFFVPEVFNRSFKSFYRPRTDKFNDDDIME